MSMPLLTTKLYIPSVRRNLVPRSRLIERLNAGLRSGCKLTLISAPAGFGKTTLCSEWAGTMCGAIDRTDESIACAWLSLDDSDNDPGRFLAYFIGALRTIEADIAKGALSALQSPQPPPAEVILTALINEIAALPGRIVLVLDDYHLIEAQPIHEALTFLLRHLPPRMHLVIATREDPPLPLAQLRARGQLSELRAADLRFSFSEAAEFLNQAMGLDLSMEDITALETRTEGWIASLHLVAVSMQGRQDVSGFIRTFSASHHFVLDYLVEEVLERQSDSIQTFLLQTAILDRLTGSLCDAVTKREDGRATLEMLDRANLFIVPLDDERHWYRYHHLFADLLRKRLNQAQSEQLPILYSRARDWFEQNGFIDAAVDYSLRFKDFGRAAHLIEGAAEGTWGRAEHTKLRGWLARLPIELVLAKPLLCIFQAGYLFVSGEQGAAERCLQAAEQALEPNSDGATQPTQAKQGPLAGADRKKLLGRIAATRAFMASYRSDAPGVVPHARLALEYLPQQDVTWRESASIALGDAYIYQGQYVKAEQRYLEALEAIKTTGNTYLIMNVSAKLALDLRSQGRLGQAIEICQQQLQLAHKSGMSQTEMVGWLLAIWGEVLAELNDLDGAIQRARKGVGLTQAGQDVAMLTWSYLCLTRILFSTGDLAGAQEIIIKTQNLARASIVPNWVNNMIAAWQVRIWLAEGRLDEALQWSRIRGLDPEKEPTYVDELAYVALARILFAQKRYAGATKLLQRLLERAEAGAHMTRVIQILILQALILQAEGEPARAMTPLERALTLAEPGGYVRIFVDDGPPVARLLAEAHRRGVAVDYTAQILAAFETTHTAPNAPSVVRRSASRVPSEATGLVEPLSERELEVLQLIAEGLSNREIASRLYLALNTVKGHTRNIYGKLDVHSRTQAVARAQELGLLPPGQP